MSILAGLITIMALGILPAAQAQSVQLVPASVLAWDADYKSVTLRTDAQEAWFDFWVTNVCATNVLVLGLETSCGCAVAQLPSLPWPLTPQMSGTIRINLDLRGRTSPLVKGVEVRTSAGLKALVVRADWPTSNALALAAQEGVRANDRLCDLQAALRDRQAVFKGHCAQCHAQPTVGKRGRDLYAAACGICHEAAPRSPLVPDLRTQALPSSPAGWKQLVAFGVEGSVMPGFARNEGGPLTDAQINSLVMYLVRERPFQPRREATEKPTPLRHPGIKPTPMSPVR